MMSSKTKANRATVKKKAEEEEAEEVMVVVVSSCGRIESMV
jgi:hypothetical protein